MSNIVQSLRTRISSSRSRRDFARAVNAAPTAASRSELIAISQLHGGTHTL